MRLSECRGQACLNYAEREHLRRSQLEMRSCHTGCKNHETKKREELFELTGDNYHLTTTLPLPYHYEPSTLPWPLKLPTASCLESMLFFASFGAYQAETINALSSMSETPLGVWVRRRHLYGWDTNTCMGEIPTRVWVRYLDSNGRADGVRLEWLSANP